MIKPLSATLGTAVTAKINNNSESNLAIYRIKNTGKKLSEKKCFSN